MISFEVYRVSCAFSAIVSQLSGRDAPRPSMTGASGFASLMFDENGQIHYQVTKRGRQ